MYEKDLDFGMFTRARQASHMSTCVRRKVGAALRSPTGLLAVGWNEERDSLDCRGDCPRAKSGVAPGSPYNGDGSCIAAHAEEKAIEFMETIHGLTNMKGFRIWVTCKPCENCIILLVNRGIGFYWEKDYP